MNRETQTQTQTQLLNHLTDNGLYEYQQHIIDGYINYCITNKLKPKRIKNDNGYSKVANRYCFINVHNIILWLYGRKGVNEIQKTNKENRTYNLIKMDNGLECNHIDHIRKNNSISNLEIIPNWLNLWEVRQLELVERKMITQNQLDQIIKQIKHKDLNETKSSELIQQQLKDNGF